MTTSATRLAARPRKSLNEQLEEINKRKRAMENLKRNQKEEAKSKPKKKLMALERFILPRAMPHLFTKETLPQHRIDAIQIYIRSKVDADKVATLTQDLDFEKIS